MPSSQRAISYDHAVLGLLRISMGMIFLWAFVDKLFGLGFSTKASAAWLQGTSPTLGYLQFATHGPLAFLFQTLAGNIFVDVLFMTGLLCIGLALILGIGVRVAGYSGAIMLMLMYLSALPPEHHPFLDEHIIYALLLILFTRVPVGEWIGFGKKWANLSVVKKYRLLQ